MRLATAVVVALFLVAGGAYLWSAGDEYREPVAVPTPIGTSSAADVLLVHVAGAVVNPGLVRLRPGARVADAVESAGGATSTADLTTINLARPVADGEQVLVPQLGENLTADAGLTNLNSASAEQLEDLPGVGPVLAKRIVQGRPYGSVADLDQISGVGPALMSQLRDLVTV